MNDFYQPTIRQRASDGVWVIDYSAKNQAPGEDYSFSVTVRRDVDGGEDTFRCFLDTLGDGRIELHEDESAIKELADVQDANDWGVISPFSRYADVVPVDDPDIVAFKDKVEQVKEDWFDQHITFKDASIRGYYPGFSPRDALEDARRRWSALSFLFNPSTNAL